MLTSSYPRHAGDGTGSFIASLARTLAARGHSVEVVAPHDPAVTPMDHKGVSVHRFRYAPSESLHVAGHARSLTADVRLKWFVPLLMPGYALSALALAQSLHRREPFDLVHGQWAVPGGVLAAAFARLARLPLVISLHGSDVYVIEHSRLYGASARWAFSRAAAVTASSGDLAQRAMAIGLARAKTTVIPYGVDLARYAAGDGARLRGKLGLSADVLVIGALGRLVEKKGFDRLLSALPRVAQAFPNVRCVVGGAGDLRDALVAQARSLGLDDCILFPGHIDWPSTPDYYAMCDVLVVPSVIDTGGNVDGLPNVLLEALASGCAVVASRVGGIPDTIVDRAQGLLVPPGDVRALSAALIELLGDAPARAALGDRARALMQQRYGWEAMAAEYEGVYHRALGSGEAAR